MRNLRSQKKTKNKKNGETTTAFVPGLTEPTPMEQCNDMNDRVIENGENAIKVARSLTTWSTEDQNDNNNPAIINNVLTFISNKMDLLAKDTLVLI